jgi:DNA-binding transcriptional MerR regulator
MVGPDSSAETRDDNRGRSVKSETAFRTISEVSDDLDVPQHVLRFWESKFSQIKPLKRGGGRRYYRPEDVRLLSHIRNLLYNDGYTIRGVQKLLREPGAKGKAESTDAARSAPKPSTVIDEHRILREILTELADLRRFLADARRP